MNAMSALYHIAQNDPPTLNMKEANWYEYFLFFVNLFNIFNCVKMKFCL